MKGGDKKMKKGDILEDKTDKSRFYKIKRINEKTILVKVLEVEDRQAGYHIGRWHGEHKRLSKDEVMKNLGEKYELRWL